jgi:LysR family transcriptional regulator of gallate degradation
MAWYGREKHLPVGLANPLRSAALSDNLLMSQVPAHKASVDQQLRNLRTFVFVADAGSISRAAEQLLKVPSAVTRSIIELEHSIGVPLFERRPRGMYLNPYGQMVLVRARRITHEIHLAVSEFCDTHGEPEGSSRSAISAFLFSGRRLQLLNALATFRSISSAASALGMTQAGASMGLARIEAALGRPLFLRAPEGVLPSDSASQLVMRAKRVFAELRYVKSDLSSLSGTLSGSVIIGTTPLGRTDILSTAIASVVSHCPALRATTVDSSYAELITCLRSGEIDFVFGALRPRPHSQGLITELISKDRLAIVVRADHPFTRRRSLRLPDLVHEKWILPKADIGSMLHAAFQAQGLPSPVPSVVAGDPALVRQLLRASDMLAVTSFQQLGFEINSGALTELPVTLEGTSREIGFVLREGAMLSPAAHALLQAVRAQVRPDLRSLAHIVRR